MCPHSPKTQLGNAGAAQGEQPHCTAPAHAACAASADHTRGPHLCQVQLVAVDRATVWPHGDAQLLGGSGGFGARGHCARKTRHGGRFCVSLGDGSSPQPCARSGVLYLRSWDRYWGVCGTAHAWALLPSLLLCRLQRSPAEPAAARKASGTTLGTEELKAGPLGLEAREEERGWFSPSQDWGFAFSVPCVLVPSQPAAELRRKVETMAWNPIASPSNAWADTRPLTQGYPLLPIETRVLALPSAQPVPWGPRLTSLSCCLLLPSFAAF